MFKPGTEAIVRPVGSIDYGGNLNSVETLHKVTIKIKLKYTRIAIVSK